MGVLLASSNRTLCGLPSLSHDSPKAQFLPPCCSKYFCLSHLGDFVGCLRRAHCHRRMKMEWLRSFMDGDSQRAHLFLVRFQYVNTSERLWLIASALKCMNCLRLLFWCVPDFLVHTSGFLAIVFRHPSNCKNFAAIRVSQQALQGSHLAPSADLRCLRDTHLESANVALDGLPINGISFRRFARDRTNGGSHRHPLCLLCRFALFSRVKPLREVGPLSRPVM
jgi:hypothetical protein